MDESVSIVIPCHNAELWIKEAILSVLSQTFHGCHVIVVDDGSTDSSPFIIRSFGENVRFVRGKWGNGSRARNEGLCHVVTKWVQFLDADDAMQPDKIRSQLDQAGGQTDALIGPLIVRTHSSTNDFVDSFQCIDPKEDLIVQWLRWEICQTGAALWKAESLRKIGGWNERIDCCQDNELMLRAIQERLNIQKVGGEAAIYRIWSEETVCRKNPKEVILKRTLLTDQMMSWLKLNGFQNRFHVEAASRAGFEMARSLAKVSIDQAASYASQRKACGLFSMGGAAGPPSFRLMARLFGYANAERFASFLRKRKHPAVHP
jgi:glycosyltransferase involved in cell wall biosynthesis